MAGLKKLGAVYLIGVAVVVAVYFIVNPWHAESYDPSNIWFVLNILMIIGLPLALCVNFRRKRAEDRRAGPGEGITRGYLAANVAFYANAGVMILFFHNWFSLRALGLELDNHQAWVIWAVVDTVLPLTLGATGCALWREAAEE